MSKDRELVDENREVYEWIRDNGHSEFVNLASECDGYTRGEQWSADVKAKLARRRKPVLTINKVLATFATLCGEYLMRRGDITFRPSVGGAPETARALDKLWIHFTQSQDFNWLEGMQFWDGVIRGRGFLDLRIDFDQAMRGEPIATYLNSKDVGLYPGDHGSDPDKWTGVMLSRWLSARDIAEMYGAKMEDVMFFADAPELEADYTDWVRDSFGSPIHDNQIISQDQRSKYRLLRVLERQEFEYRWANCFVDTATGEVREIPPAWDRERIQDTLAQYGYGVVRRRVRKINWVVTVGDMLLHNAISPYKHFTPVPYFPFLIGGKPTGIVEHLRDSQNLLNKVLSQELHIVAGIANSGYKVKKGSLSNMTTEQLQERGGEDGIVIEVNDHPENVQKIVPNQVPTGLDRLSYIANESIAQISLVNSSLQGLNRADESGSAILNKAERGSAALAPIYTSLDYSRKLLARNWLDLTQQFVTEERAYVIMGEQRTAEPEQVEVNVEQFDGTFLNDLTLGEYAVYVTNVNDRSSYQQDQFELMMSAIRAGAPIPWSEVVNSLDVLENRTAIVDYLKGIEGRADPTEQDMEQKAMQKRLAEAEALDKEATATVKQAQAQKAQAQTQATMKGDQRLMLDAQVKERELQLKEVAQRQKAELDLQMARERLLNERKKLEMQLEFERQKNELELQKLRASIASEAAKSQLKQQEANVYEGQNVQTF